MVVLNLDLRDRYSPLFPAYASYGVFRQKVPPGYSVRALRRQLQSWCIPQNHYAYVDGNPVGEDRRILPGETVEFHHPWRP
jgi:hypothetical protein